MATTKEELKEAFQTGYATDPRVRSFVNRYVTGHRNFTGIDLSNAELGGIHLPGVNLTAANLSGTQLGETDLTEATLATANLKRAKLSRTKLTKATLDHADLSYTQCRGTLLTEANLTGSDLTGADFASADLVRAKLAGATLTGTGFFGACLMYADLAHANLTHVNFSGANLLHANLTGSDLHGALLCSTYFDEANLSKADLTRAALNGAILTNANLSGSTLRGASLGRVNFFQTNLAGTDFRGARFGSTAFGALDFRVAVGLEEAVHGGPSSLGIDTIYSSQGEIPTAFMRGCGVPDELITFARSLARKALDFYSCFISFSTKDEEFAHRIHADLQERNVRCWFAPHDVHGGEKLHEQIDAAIRTHDKLLLLLSEHSMSSPWVQTEIRRARKQEAARCRRVLFPLRLCSFEAIRDWECFDSDAGKDLASEIREYFVPDFSQWKDHDAYKAAFDRLLRDLKSNSWQDS